MTTPPGFYASAVFDK